MSRIPGCPSKPWWFQSTDNHQYPLLPPIPPPRSRRPNGCRVLQTAGMVQSLPFTTSNTPFTELIPFSLIKPIDFDAEVTLFHFNLLRCVGKGAFGKVCAAFLLAHCHSSFRCHRRSGSFSTSRRRISTPSNTSTRLVASGRKPSQTSSRRESCSKRSVATLQSPSHLSTCGRHPVSVSAYSPSRNIPIDRSPFHRQLALCLPRRRKLLLRPRPHAWG